MNTTLVSIHAIVVSDPNADLVHTGKFTKHGEPIIKKSSIKVPPGAFFEIESDEAEKLVAAGAARHPTGAEIAVGEVIVEQRNPFVEDRA